MKSNHAKRNILAALTAGFVIASASSVVAQPITGHQEDHREHQGHQGQNHQGHQGHQGQNHQGQQRQNRQKQKGQQRQQK